VTVAVETATGGLRREYLHWHSASLDREMEILLFGHAGRPVLVFPTSMGRFFEFEDRGMVEALTPSIQSGSIQLVCVDSVDRESWYNHQVPPPVRVARYLQYERYILDEVLPLARSRHDGDGRVAATGCSLGAFHAALLAFRHPGVVSDFIGLSGAYDNSTFLHGYSDLDTYLTNPLAFLPDLGGQQLEDLRRMRVVIVSGSDDPHIDQARSLAAILESKRVPTILDVWPGWLHDWPYWREMIRKYL